MISNKTAFYFILILVVLAIAADIIVGLIIQPPIEIFLVISFAFLLILWLAAQDVLRNIFGGMMILFNKPFSVGDKIEFDKCYGEVVTIGIASTKIVTSDNSVVNIPNSEIMKVPVRNINSGEHYCQVTAEFYLPIEVDTIRIRELALEAAKVSKYIYLNKPVEVLFFNEVKEKNSYLKMLLKAYVMDIKYELIFKSEMTETVIRELISEGIIEKKILS